MVNDSIPDIVDEALNSPEILAGLNKPPDYIREGYLRARLLERADQIKREASPALAAAKAADDDMAARRLSVSEATSYVATDAAFLSLGFATAIIAGIIITIGAIFHWTWSLAALTWLIYTQTGRIVTLTIVLSIVLGSFRLYREFMVASPRRSRDASMAAGLDEALKRVEAAHSDANTAIRVAVLQNATLILNETSRRFYQDRIYLSEADNTEQRQVRITIPRGLAEVVNPQNEIETDERKRVISMIENLPGASIGVAGPRGAGKSTLLWSICGTNPYVVGKASAITVATSAPVQYEARDFLMHLYSSVCKAVLAAEGVPEERSDRTVQNMAAPPDPTNVIIEFARRLSPLFITIGLLLVISVMVIRVMTPVLEQTAQRVGVLPSAAKATPSATSTPGTQPVQVDSKSVLTAVTQWGTIAALLGFAIAVYGLIAQSWRTLLLPPFLKRIARVDAERKRQLRREAVSRQQRAHDSSLVSLCQSALESIRFQRSFTSGWSGSLKAIPGLDLGLSGAMSLAQQQETLPELVSDFVSFLKFVTTSGSYSRVLIAIDELDKLKSDEDAERFLNEIKAIFNVPNCYFLISVSESAISAFERRGLPFRDAFDSAFDDVVRVSYLTLDESHLLLSRRVVNLPENFLGLAHILSAGLPRDLIRVARGILDYAAENPDKTRLPEICVAVLAREVRNKAQAIAIAARSIALEPERSTFLMWTLALQDESSTPFEIIKGRNQPIINLRAGLDDDDKALYRRLSALRNELNAYLAYCITTIDLFEQIVSEATWRDASWLRQLATCRQSFEVGSGVARMQIQALRLAMNLTEITVASETDERLSGALVADCPQEIAQA